VLAIMVVLVMYRSHELTTEFSNLLGIHGLG